MALSDALSLPACIRVQASDFRLNRVEARSPATGGTVDVFERATPRYTWALTVGPLKDGEDGDWTGFFGALRGGQNTFRAYDPFRQRPRNYPSSTDPETVTADSALVTADSIAHAADDTLFAWGNPRLSNVDTAARTVGLQDMAAGAVIKAGDPLSYEDGTNLWRLVATQDATANASGVISALPVDLVPVGLASYPAPVSFYRAACEMRIVSESIETPRQRARGAVVRFEAFQVIRSA
jgi:hypothetical protein